METASVDGNTTPGGTRKSNEKALLARVWGSFDSK